MTGRSRTGLSLTSRLMLAQGIVVAAAILTAALVAALAGPVIFHDHLLDAGSVEGSPELAHAEAAYASANRIALVAALAIALTAAGIVTWYLTGRMTRPLELLAAAAVRLSRGDYSARVPPLGAGPELARLAETYNEVADRLQTTEDTRRRLLSDLAHELRTPVSTIAAYLDGLEDGVTTWSPQTARVLRDQTVRLVRLADDIGEVSRVEEGRLGLRRAPVRVGDLLATAARAASAVYAAKGVRLLPPDPGPPRRPGSPGRPDGCAVVVDADRSRVLQILANLLDNALRHTEAGGSVALAAHATADGAAIEVRDTGEGISARHLPHVFERFYVGDAARDHGGSGIGLAIARSIATAHGGTLTAESRGPGQGSTFRLTLPAAGRPSAARPRRESTTRPG